jgi:fumarylpyruvate hydrolase
MPTGDGMPIVLGARVMRLPVVEVPTAAIQGSRDRFPVRRIFCVGQNYAAHAREMGSDPERKPPFFFSKPADAVASSGATLSFPSKTRELHHEVELVVALGLSGVNVSAADAGALVFGWAVGLDLTRRDLQSEAKTLGRPWDMAKGFDSSAPLGPLVLGTPPLRGAIALTINSQVRQSGDLADMIWSVAEIIATLSTYVRLSPGDLIFTGTPAGVGPIYPGEVVVGTVAGAPPIEVSFVQPANGDASRSLPT